MRTRKPPCTGDLLPFLWRTLGIIAISGPDYIYNAYKWVPCVFETFVRLGDVVQIIQWNL